ncbi:MAG: hypothetical protein AABZ39_21030 [Spirochaetota bacterium]
MPAHAYIAIGLTIAMLTIGCAPSNPLMVTSNTYTVDINKQYSPGTLTIAVGDTVQWKNSEGGAQTVTSGTIGKPDGMFDSGDIAPGATFSMTFTTAGTISYYSRNARAMSGVLTVE